MDYKVDTESGTYTLTTPEGLCLVPRSEYLFLKYLTQWKPIESLPEIDGIRVLTKSRLGHIEIGKYELYPGGWYLKSEIPDAEGYCETIDAIQWMGLPTGEGEVMDIIKTSSDLHSQIHELSTQYEAACRHRDEYKRLYLGELDKAKKPTEDHPAYTIFDKTTLATNSGRHVTIYYMADGTLTYDSLGRE